ncbi:MAG: NAD-dependent deacylase [Roseiarcus sp.]
MNVFVLTGAGVSAESGLSTFRNREGGGLWAKFDPMKLASPEAFARDPETVHAFYNARRKNLLNVAPNAAHAALARLEAGLAARGGALTLVTQNIDDLHERAGSGRVIHMHGELLKARCALCEEVTPRRDDIGLDSACGGCGRAGAMRPHVVWFGEIPFEMAGIHAALARADLFVAIGTSGAVHPAAGFVAIARRAGAATCEINLEPSDNADLFETRRYGRASQETPKWVDEVLAEAAAGA